MKKILLCLCLMAGFGACSSDDEDEKVPIEIKESELSMSDPGFYYYLSSNLNIHIVSHYYVGDYVEIRSCDAFCPLDHKGVSEKSYIQGLAVKPYPDGEMRFRCSSCKAEYNYFSGKSANDIAKGSQINTYKTEYNKETKTYTIWK